MRCAKCGNKVDPESPECPHCASGAVCFEPDDPPRVRCPRCGSTELDTVRRTYNPGCGCLGLLLFSWWGLLLGFLGGGDVETVCRNCGARWPTGRHGMRGFGLLISAGLAATAMLSGLARIK